MTRDLYSGLTKSAAIRALTIGVITCGLGGCDPGDEATLTDALRSTTCEPMQDGAITGLDAGSAMDGGEAEGVEPDASSDATVPDVNEPSGPTIIMNGTGCPAGTAVASWSPDGDVVRVMFSNYLLSVDERQSVDVKNCQFGLRLPIANGFTFSLVEATLTGYAFLERGVELRATWNYYFQGTPLRAESSRGAITGPYDDQFQFKDTASTAKLVAAPCGVSRALQINTTLRLRNSSDPRRTGYATMSDGPGETPPLYAQFRIKRIRC